MFPFSNPMIPFFENAKKVASNIPAYGEKGEYTVDMFSSDFPQFYTQRPDFISISINNYFL